MESSASTLKNEAELYSVLLGYYGRIIRVRSVAKEIDSSGATARWRQNTTDLFGKFSGATLTDTLIWKITSKDNVGGYKTLSISFEDGRSLALPFGNSFIETLQSDSGNWVPIHRGTQWEEETA